MRFLRARNVLDLEDGEKAVTSGDRRTPANVQYYGYKRNHPFHNQAGEVAIAVNFFNQPYLADKIELGATVAIFGKCGIKLRLV